MLDLNYQLSVYVMGFDIAEVGCGVDKRSAPACRGLGAKVRFQGGRARTDFSLAWLEAA